MATKKPEPSIKEMRRHFPAGYSKEIKKFVKERALVHSRYIWILDRADKQKGWCSYCRRDVIIKDGLKHNAEIQCPHCGIGALVKHEWRGRSELVDKSYFHYYEKSKVYPKVIVCRGIYVKNNFAAQDVKSVKTEYETHSFYVLEMGAPRMYTDFYHVWYSQPLQSIKKSVFPRFVNYAGLKNMNFEESYESLEAAAQGTPFQYSQWKEYMQNDAYRSDNLICYLALYAKYPSVEYIMKLGLGKLIAKRLDGHAMAGALYYRGNTPQKVLRMQLSRADIADLKAAAPTIQEKTLLLWQIMKRENANVKLSEITKDDFASEHISRIHDLYPKIKSIEKMKKYYAKQTAFSKFYEKDEPKWAGGSCKIGHFLSDWIDYLDACKKLEFDMKDPSVLFPKDLKQAHDNAIEQVKISANERLDKKIRARAKALDNFNFRYGDLVAAPAASSGELITEGKVLHHCVGMYTERYAAGSTNIIFIRQAEVLDKPFFTMEVNKNNEIVQVRGNHNKAVTSQVAEFVSVFKNKVLKAKKKVRQAK